MKNDSVVSSRTPTEEFKTVEAVVEEMINDNTFSVPLENTGKAKILTEEQAIDQVNVQKNSIDENATEQCIEGLIMNNSSQSNQKNPSKNVDPSNNFEDKEKNLETIVSLYLQRKSMLSRMLLMGLR